METAEDAIARAAPTVALAQLAPKKDRDIKQPKAGTTPLKFRSFQDFYLTQGKTHNRDFLTAQKGRREPWKCQISHTPNNAMTSMAGEEDVTIPTSYKTYNEEELSTALKGHVKRLCDYFQNGVPNKNYANTIKAMVAKTKPRQPTHSSRSDSSCSTTNSLKKNDVVQTSPKAERVSAPAVGIVELAQHIASRRSEGKRPSTNQEALEFLENEGIAYNNALMVMGHDRSRGRSRQVFNWKTAMKAMCTGTDVPDTPDSSILDGDEVVRVDLPLPLDPEMREFLRKRGFVIGEDGMPITAEDDVVECDGVQFYVLPHQGSMSRTNSRANVSESQPREVWADLKTGAVVPEVSQCPHKFKTYDLRITKETTEPDVSLGTEEEEFEGATRQTEEAAFFDKTDYNLDDFTNHMFGYADLQNIDQVINHIRNILPEECDGENVDVAELSTDRREKNAESFGWFLDNAQETQGDTQSEAQDELAESFENGLLISSSG
ncbi:taurine catabolism dioxygenase, putative [Babesia ovata]|uniref:Taurine catabolism dioxygenase, putative n=1 Tax=Babesia ovata TaxID=189622 RepID=A0A2H6K7H3_9APIC|nr:taurine catabolism dioxygenase, putative [Babesia ovata]GBE58947.1 taurine catabolism dioxygenase, putative [Babesia ovata]